MQANQPHTLRSFTALHLLQQNWAGNLIVSCGLDTPGASLAIAATIAGACCLSVEDNPASLKLAMRDGACDFVVTTLDEALRTLKNEVRKKLPLSVGLLASPSELLAELADRGVLPDLLNAPHIATPVVTKLESLGARLSDFSAPTSEALATADRYAQSQNWRLATCTAPTSRELTALDEAALAALPQDDVLRRHWLRTAPRFFRRELPLSRTVWQSVTR